MTSVNRMGLAPVVIATCQATAISSTSNVLAQFIDARRSQAPFALDFLALLNFAIVTVLTAPPNFYWQMWLERTFPGRKPNPSNRYTYVSKDEMDMEERGVESKKHNDQRDSQAEDSRPPLDIKNTITKWIVDCWTMGALLNTIVFLFLMGLLKGKTGQEILSSIRFDTIPIIVASYKFWPFASVINFSLIPVEKRILFLSSCALIWNTWLSLFAAKM